MNFNSYTELTNFIKFNTSNEIQENKTNQNDHGSQATPHTRAKLTPKLNHTSEKKKNSFQEKLAQFIPEIDSNTETVEKQVIQI